MNFLRDPLERYISQYYFWRTLGDIGPSTSKVGKSLEECTEQSHLYGCPPLNYMTSYMCGGDATICSDPPDEQASTMHVLPPDLVPHSTNNKFAFCFPSQTFLRAKRNLITQYGMVGLTEQVCLMTSIVLFDVVLVALVDSDVDCVRLDGSIIEAPGHDVPIILQN